MLSPAQVKLSLASVGKSRGDTLFVCASAIANSAIKWAFSEVRPEVIELRHPVPHMTTCKGTTLTGTAWVQYGVLTVGGHVEGEA